MDIMSNKALHCLQCKQELEVWRTRKPEFTCPECGIKHRSTYKSALKQSLWLGLGLWLASSLISFLVTQSWQITLALSIEIGGIGAALIAAWVHRLRSHIYLLK